MSNLPHPLSVPVRSVTLLLSAADSSKPKPPKSENDPLATAHAEETSDSRVAAEAEAAVKVLAGPWKFWQKLQPWKVPTSTLNSQWK
jgi:hypothetical protein